jgi:pimeloyl-ACP methyl ester carboxylesterase
MTTAAGTDASFGALMDALGIDRTIIAGFDWGARTANVMAALWPERCKAMVSVRGYLIGSPEANETPLPPKAELQWWYQYYFATEGGRAGSAWHKVSQPVRTSNGGAPRLRSSACPPSPSKVTRMAHHTRIPPPTPRSSPAGTPTGSSRVVSGTTCRRKPPGFRRRRRRG